MSLSLLPISIREAKQYVVRWHRHSSVPRIARFALAAQRAGDFDLCGVGVVGNPKARRLQDGETVEVLRVATDGTRNACSFLYAACVREARRRGFRRVITYTLARESGASLRAVGAVRDAEVRGGSWHRRGRPRTDKTTSQREDKVRWLLFPITDTHQGGG